MSKTEVAFVVPYYNETGVLEQTIKPLLNNGNVILVDDGSRINLDLSEKIFFQLHYLRHINNRGQGAALQTGFDYIIKKLPNIRWIVTFDSDGQHSSENAFQMIRVIKEGYDIVLGSRFLSIKNEIPKFKALILKFFALTYSIRNGRKFTDRHFGLRVLSRKFIQKYSLQNSGFGHADEFMDIISKHALNYCEYPSSVIYTTYSKSKGQPMINGINILFDRILKAR
jgi:glycosyltransferase involved in cell wall biosynthesis